MNFLDGLQDAAEEAFSNFGSEVVQDAIDSVGFIQLGPKPAGNPTAKEVMSGGRGRPLEKTVSVRSSAETSSLKNGFGFSFGSMGAGAMTPILIIGGLVAAALLLRKK